MKNPSAPPPDSTSAQLLAGLEPNIEPEAIGFWPPAPGWWLLGCLTAVFCFLAGRRLWKQRKANRYRRQALRTANALYRQHGDGSHAPPDTMALAKEYNRLLKAVALHTWPRARVASLYGERWLQFLGKTQQNQRDAQALSALGLVLYAAQPPRPSQITAEQLHRAVLHWIKTHRPIPALKKITAPKKESKAS